MSITTAETANRARAVRPIVRRAELWLDEEFRGSLARCGLSSFDDIMHGDAGEVFEAKPGGRENRRIVLIGRGGQSQTVYLKKHRIRTFSTRWRARSRLSISTTPSWLEVDSINKLEQDGIRTMRVIGYGEQLTADGWLESFVMTQGLRDHVSLQDYLLVRGDRDSTRRDAEFLRILDLTADLARTFHDAGYNHRDFYCSHVFLHRDEEGKFSARLIDLQRVQNRRRWRMRWLVKDLTQLAYSSQGLLSAAQKMRFIKRYLGVDKLHFFHKLFIWRILLKQWYMTKKLGPWKP